MALSEDDREWMEQTKKSLNEILSNLRSEQFRYRALEARLASIEDRLIKLEQK